MKNKKIIFVIFSLIVVIAIILLCIWGYYFLRSYYITTDKFNKSIEEILNAKFSQTTNIDYVSIYPMEKIEVKNFSIVNKVGFFKKFFIVADKVVFPISISNYIGYLKDKVVVLNSVIVENPKFYLEISKDSGINFPNRFPTKLLQRVKLFSYQKVPIVLDLNKVTFLKPTIYFYLNKNFIGKMKVSFINVEITKDKKESKITVLVKGEKTNLLFFNSSDFWSETNAIVSNVPFGSGIASFSNVVFEKLPFSEKFQEFYNLPLITSQNFSSLKVNFSFSDREFIISNLKCENDNIKLGISGTFNISGDFKFEAKYSLPSESGFFKTYSIKVINKNKKIEFIKL